MSSSHGLLLLSVWATVSVASEIYCSADKTCPTDLHCYRSTCRTPAEIAKLAFKAGEACSEPSDCPEACQTRLVPAVCGPYLRSVREPGARHPDHCSSHQDCQGEEQCIATPRGLECSSWQQIMYEFFHLGKDCEDHDDCPEACYTSYDRPMCGPYH